MKEKGFNEGKLLMISKMSKIPAAKTLYIISRCVLKLHRLNPLLGES